MFQIICAPLASINSQEMSEMLPLSRHVKIAEILNTRDAVSCGNNHYSANESSNLNSENPEGIILLYYFVVIISKGIFLSSQTIFYHLSCPDGIFSPGEIIAIYCCIFVIILYLYLVIL